MRKNAILAAKAAGVRHVVMSTGLGADPASPFRLGRMHGENEKQLRESGMAWTFLQPTFFMQNLLMSAAEIRSRGTFHLPLDGGRVSWIDARDIAAVGVRALLDDGFANRELPLTGPEALGGDEMARIFSELLGREVRYLPAGLEETKRAMLAAGMPEELAEGLAELWALAPAGHLAQVSETVEAVTGRPARTFRQFVDDHRAAFLGEGEGRRSSRRRFPPCSSVTARRHSRSSARGRTTSSAASVANGRGRGRFSPHRRTSRPRCRPSARRRGRRPSTISTAFPRSSTGCAIRRRAIPRSPPAPPSSCAGRASRSGSTPGAASITASGCRCR